MKKYGLIPFVLFLLLAGCFAENEFRDNFGRRYQLDASNHKWLIINVWATWCPPCIEEMPEFNRFYEKHHEQLIILGANYDNIRGEKMRKAVKRFRIKFPMLQGRYEEVFHMESVTSVPTTFVFNAQGKLMETLYGPQTVKTLESCLKRHGLHLVEE